jgi:hypothetical protein
MVKTLILGLRNVIFVLNFSSVSNNVNNTNPSLNGKNTLPNNLNNVNLIIYQIMLIQIIYQIII